MTMKNLLGALFLGGGLEALARRARARRRVTILVYHAPPPAVLRRHLAWLARRYAFTTLDAVAEALETGRWEALPDYPLVITLDDGHRSNARLEGAFREFGVRPTLYLSSAIVDSDQPFWWLTQAARILGTEALKALPDTERRQRLEAAGGERPGERRAERQALNRAELERLGQVADFGAHTRHHPILIRCDDAVAADEIAGSGQDVARLAGRACRHFAYPNGDYGRRELDLVAAAGYRTARAIEPGRNGPDADRFRLKAFVISDEVGIGWLAVQTTGLAASFRHIKTKTIAALRKIFWK